MGDSTKRHEPLDGVQEGPDVHEEWPNTGVPDLIEIVSSDNVSFFVPRLLLQAHCPVLRAMFEIPQSVPSSPPRRSSRRRTPEGMAQLEPRSDQIILTDDFYELASTLAFFLAIISGESCGSLLQKVPRYQIRNFHATILLAKKWESAMVVHTLEAWLCRLALERWDNEQWKPSDILILAAKCDMPHVARMVLETWTQVKKDSPLWNDSKHDKASIDAHWSVRLNAGGSTLSPKDWRILTWQEIGIDYIFALVKSARGKAGGSAGNSLPEGSWKVPRDGEIETARGPAQADLRCAPVLAAYYCHCPC